MQNVNWDEVKEESSRPVPGGYAARITKVEDHEDREFLLIQWDFAEGEYKGSNQDTFDQFGFWPMAFVRSYKQKALPFFKGFKTAVEMSNRNYVFRNDPQSLVGKFVGVVLGEEEYQAKDGTIKTRLYVDQVRSGKAIRDGDYKIPELKKYVPTSTSAAQQAVNQFQQNFAPIVDEDADLPF